jgi:hypothetical protein
LKLKHSSKGEATISDYQECPPSRTSGTMLYYHLKVVKGDEVCTVRGALSFLPFNELNQDFVRRYSQSILDNVKEQTLHCSISEGVISRTSVTLTGVASNHWTRNEFDI